MEIETVGELIALLKKHPNKTRVYVTKTKTRYAPLYTLESVATHMFDGIIFLVPGKKKHEKDRET